MATIEKTGKKWRVRQFVDGRLRTVARCATKPDALVMLRRVEEQERARGSVPRGSQLPMGEILARWRLAKVSTGNDPLHTSEAESRLRYLCNTRNWQGTASITAVAVSDYRQAGGSARTCAFLAGVLRWARDTLDQYVDPKALVGLRPGKAGRKPSPVLMSADQVAMVEERAQAMSASAGALVHCLASYGWRPITAARLRVSDFDPVAGTITCQVKGGDVVRHPLQPETLRRLRALVASTEPDAPLFLDPRRDNEGWALRGSRTIDQWSRDHLRVKVYDLKRYAISTMLGRGVPPQDIASFTGHRTISQVLRYSRTNEERQRAVLSMMSAPDKEPAEAPAEAPKPGRGRGLDLLVPREN